MVWQSRSCWHVLAMVCLLTCSGCAPAYRWYPCGRVPYCYQARSPLPYQMYHGCPTPIASCYTQHATAEQPTQVPPIRPADAAQPLPEENGESTETVDDVP